MKVLAKLRYMAIITVFAAVPFVAGEYAKDTIANNDEVQAVELAQEVQLPEEQPRENQQQNQENQEQRQENQEQEQQQQENQEQQPQENQENQDQEAEQNQEQPTGKYEYTAQPDDTYSQLARKAVQTYGILNNVDLSGAQIIYAETHLTQAANSPFLMTGQKVTLNEATVKEWVDKARELSDQQKVAWQPYTVGVNFNTDNVGE